MSGRVLVVTLGTILAFGGLPGHSRAQSAGPGSAPAKKPAAASWKFAVSGDSRNCGDIVMPAIAAGVKKSGASFYWHLGDFRKISDIDEDIQHQPEHLAKLLTKPEYEDLAWKDFIANQIEPFGSLRVYLARGNHETIPPKGRGEYLAQFSSWLDASNLRAQRLRDDPGAVEPRTYYHWIVKGIDFITLDNSEGYEFNADQMAWFETTLRADSAKPGIRTIVVGMHEALPESISKGHSMNESEGGTESGRRVYADLLDAQNQAHKRIYVLASHSHYFMDGTFNTDYWREHGGILPGWIIGTAGAERYALPDDSAHANAAETNVYGFLLATVSPSGKIRFDFQRLSEQDVPAAVTARYSQGFVHWCFEHNSQAR
ncbi:MAG TPA: metallophosphoesterase [Candidatus Acidoferrum sp.]|nr:metallophosphoesterase [Candidatus Acidoferrum sp.]